MVVWQFISTAKEPRCFSSPSINYDGQEDQTCSPASLLFASQYYTRANGNVSAEIGMFPYGTAIVNILFLTYARWIMGGFGNGTANLPIDYAIQSYNYTGELNNCQVRGLQLLLLLICL